MRLVAGSQVRRLVAAAETHSRAVGLVVAARMESDLWVDDRMEAAERAHDTPLMAEEKVRRSNRLVAAAEADRSGHGMEVDNDLVAEERRMAVVVAGRGVVDSPAGEAVGDVRMRHKAALSHALVSLRLRVVCATYDFEEGIGMT